jgi:hypothetical protein
MNRSDAGTKKCSHPQYGRAYAFRQPWKTVTGHNGKGEVVQRTSKP